jgi:hypothetical protein
MLRNELHHPHNAVGTGVMVAASYNNVGINKYLFKPQLLNWGFFVINA